MLPIVVSVFPIYTHVCSDLDLAVIFPCLFFLSALSARRQASMKLSNFITTILRTCTFPQFGCPSGVKFQVLSELLLFPLIIGTVTFWVLPETAKMNTKARHLKKTSRATKIYWLLIMLRFQYRVHQRFKALKAWASLTRLSHRYVQWRWPCTVKKKRKL